VERTHFSNDLSYSPIQNMNVTILDSCNKTIDVFLNLALKEEWTSLLFFW